MKSGRYRHFNMQAMLLCTECGAVVADDEAHDRWHDEAVSRTQLADYFDKAASHSESGRLGGSELL